MAMRRRRSFRPVRRRGGVRPSVAPQRWQAANFNVFLQQDVPQDPLVGTTVMIELANIPGHIGDQATGQGQTLSDMAKKFEIGGLVFDVDVFPVNVQVSGVVQIIHFTEFLATIQTDTDGNPTLVPDYFQTQKPIALANVNDTLSNDTDFPLRTHYRSSFTELFPKEDSGGFYWHRSRTRPSGTKSIRLRRFLDDRQGLYLGVSCLQNTITLASFFVRFSGTLYYRVRF